MAFQHGERLALWTRKVTPPSSIKLDVTDILSPEPQIIHRVDYTVIEVPEDFCFHVRQDNLDPEGFFYIWVEKAPLKIELSWYRWIDREMAKAEPAEVYYGTNARSLYDFVAASHPRMKVTSAATLGYELGKAEQELLGLRSKA